MQTDVMPNTPEGAGSFGSDDLEPPEEPLDVTVNDCRGRDGEVLYTAQWQTTDTVSIGQFISIANKTKLHASGTSIGLAIGTAYFNHQHMYARMFKV